MIGMHRSRLIVLMLLLLAFPAGLAGAEEPREPAPVERPAPGPAPEEAASPGDEALSADEDPDELSPEEAARRLRSARLALEKFHQAILKQDLETAWDALTPDERRLSFDDDFEVFLVDMEELREDESEWVFFRTMTFGDIELDEDDPSWAYATIFYEDEDGEEDEDQVDLLYVRGRWLIDDGYF